MAGARDIPIGRHSVMRSRPLQWSVVSHQERRGLSGELPTGWLVGSNQYFL